MVTILCRALLLSCAGVFFWAALLAVEPSTAAGDDAVTASAAAGKSKKTVEQEYNDAIDSTMAGITNNVATLSEKAKNSHSIFTDRQKKFLSDANDRAQKARKRANDEGGFKAMNHKKNYDKTSKAKQSDPNDPNDTEFDEESAQDTLSQLSDVNDVLSEMNEQVQVRQSLLALADVSTTTPNRCSSVLVLNRQFTDAQIIGIKTAASATGMGYDICDSACNQDAFGWNCSAACVALAIAKGVLECVGEGFAMSDDNVTSARIDASCGCLEQVGSDLIATKNQAADIGEKLAQLQATIAALQQELAAQFDQINEKVDTVNTLLNTPQGQRASFPTKTAPATTTTTTSTAVKKK